jgi:hypothetical protein
MVDLTNLNLNVNGKIISDVDEELCDHGLKMSVMLKEVACLSVLCLMPSASLYNLSVLSAKIPACFAVLLVAVYAISLTS